MSPVLELDQLNVYLPLSSGAKLHAVRDVSFQLQSNEILAIVGESGCGKSMTALAIMDLLHHRAQRQLNQLTFLGKDISRLSNKAMNRLRGDRMAMIFQEPMTSLNPVYTIGNQLQEVYLKHRQTTRLSARRRAIELLDKVGISAPEQRMNQYPHQLSGGLRQRVMIAMALMCEPDLIIADEPTTALDVTIQVQVLALLKQLQREFEMAIIIITHDLSIVARIADRVQVMYAGEIVESGKTRDIFNNPYHPYTQGLLNCLPVRQLSESENQRLGVIPGTVPNLAESLKGCGFANRCKYATELCLKESINTRSLDENHRYRCLLPPETSRTNHLDRNS